MHVFPAMKSRFVPPKGNILEWKQCLGGTGRFAGNMLPAMKNVAGNLSDFGGDNITLLGEISSCCRELIRLLGMGNSSKEPPPSSQLGP